MPIKNTTTATFKTTIKSLNFADSLIPRISTAEITQRISTAIRLILPGCGSNGDATIDRGISMPNDTRIESNVAAQLTDTVAAATAYSSTSAQPIIHAANSPKVA